MAMASPAPAALLRPLRPLRFAIASTASQAGALSAGRAGGSHPSACRAPFGVGAAPPALAPSAPLALALQRRGAWTEADKSLSFKVRADDVNLNKLAGGILRRCDQDLETFLEAMGVGSIYNSIKAVNLANKYIAKRRSEGEGGQASSPSPVHVKGGARELLRIGIVPLFGRKDDNLWMNLKIVGLTELNQAEPSELEPLMLKVSRSTDMQLLETAIVTNWGQRCSGLIGDPGLMAMGGESVSIAVKASAFAIKSLRLLRSGSRPFLLVPSFELVPGAGDGAPTLTTAVLRLERQPQRGAASTVKVRE